ncbi:MAG: tail fiber domain-containing protein, partial [Chitinophagales bacterium]|nr:tail fiber domain-containing protein [Chitinophagales bacterium]
MKTLFRFCLSLVIALFFFLKSFPQASILSNNAGTSLTPYLGWDGTLGNPALDIKTTLNQPINFFTSGSKHMVLDAFGILDLVNATQYYSLGGSRILSYGGGGNSSSVFVGRGAGAAWGMNRLTFVGNNAGATCNGADDTYLGYNAGRNDILGDFNTFIGSQSGLNTTTTAPGVFGNSNSFLGAKSGQTNKSGNFNTILGANADITVDSIHRTVVLGANASVGASNSNAIGYGCIAPTRNTMILGSNFINVGIGLSNNLLGPQNKLEINDNINFGSGLRFRQLTSSSTPQSSNGLALSVDANGDVILVPDQVGGSAGASLGNPCNSSPVPLNTDWEIPFVDPSNPNIQNSMYMSGQSDMSANNPADLGIGYTCGTPLQAKLDVYNYTNNTASPITPFYSNAYAGRFVHAGNYYDLAGTTDMVGVLVENNVSNNYLPMGVPSPSINQSRNIGTHSIALGNRVYNIGTLSETRPYLGMLNQYGTGVLGMATGSDIQGDGVLGIAHSNTMNVGVHGVAAQSIKTGNVIVNTLTSVGGLFMTYDDQSGAFNTMNNAHFLNSGLNLYGAHIGVYGGVENSSNNQSGSLMGLFAGVYGEAASQTNSWAGYFNGNIGTTAGFFQVSDSIVKTSVVNLSSDSSLHILAQLHPKTYTLDSANYPSLGLNSQPQIGLFAQEVERVIPSAVRLIHHPATIDSVGNIITAAYDVKGLNYLELIPVLISAIKSLDSTNKSLQDQINTITAAQTGARSAAASPSNAVAKGTEVHLS